MDWLSSFANKLGTLGSNTLFRSSTLSASPTHPDPTSSVTPEDNDRPVPPSTMVPLISLPVTSVGPPKLHQAPLPPAVVPINTTTTLLQSEESETHSDFFDLPPYLRPTTPDASSTVSLPAVNHYSIGLLNSPSTNATPSNASPDMGGGIDKDNSTRYSDVSGSGIGTSINNTAMEEEPPLKRKRIMKNRPPTLTRTLRTRPNKISTSGADSSAGPVISAAPR
jgi:hypothetical protein